MLRWEGTTPWDLYVQHLLKLSGVTVEQVNLPAYADMNETTLHTSVQVVPYDVVEEAMTGTEIDAISFMPLNQTDGVQIKLNNAFGWKVSILEDIPEAAPGTGRPASRKRTAVSEATTVLQSRNLYEIVVDCSSADQEPCLRTTVAGAQIFTINLAFKKADKGVVIKNEWPEIGQRRVDVLFINEHVITAQVHSVFFVLFCALCSVLRALNATHYAFYRSRSSSTTVPNSKTCAALQCSRTHGMLSRKSTTSRSPSLRRPFPLTCPRPRCPTTNGTGPFLIFVDRRSPVRLLSCTSAP